MNPLLLAVLAYAGFLAVLGLVLSRRVSGAADFFVAGRKLGPGLLFSTFLAANLGAGTTVGAAEFAYRSGLSAWWWVGSAGLGSLVLAFVVGPRIYTLAAKHNLYTVGDYLELRYSRAARLATASILWLGSLAILAGQLIAMGLVLEVVAGLPRAWGCALGGVIVTIYFTAGGLSGSAWINVVQVTVKAAGFLIATPWALSQIGGWNGLAERAAALAPAGYLSITGIGAAGVVQYAAILIPAFIISPGLIQKLFGARDEPTVRRAVGLQGFVLLGYSFLPVILGMIAFVTWPNLENPGLALPTLLAEAMPPALGGLMLAAIFSAEISSADAVLFMMSTSVARDFGPHILGREPDDRALLRLARITAVAAGAAGVGIAVYLDSILSALVIFYSLLTVTLFVPLLAGLFSKRPAASAALASMAAGVPVTLAAHVATDGAGFGLLTPTLLGIAVGGVFFLLFSMRKGVKQ